MLICLLLLLAPTSQPGTFTNPIKPHGADPWMTYFNGQYYLATTGRDIRVRHAAHVSELADARDDVVWHDDDPSRNQSVWAPEFHLFDTPAGPRWFLYYTAADGQEPHHRIYVCESAADDPMGPYTFKTKLKTDADDKFYAIDATILRQGGKLYLLWCGRPSEHGQGLYIAPMSDPLTISGPRVSLEASGFGEHVPVREGPEILQHAGRTFLVYSCQSADTPDYKLGAIVCDEKSDPLQPASWKQIDHPLLVRNDAAHLYGPGHCYFFKSPDGKDDWIVFHAKTTTEKRYNDRATFVQPVRWTTQGEPDLGVIQPAGTAIPEPAGH